MHFLVVALFGAFCLLSCSTTPSGWVYEFEQKLKTAESNIARNCAISEAAEVQQCGLLIDLYGGGDYKAFIRQICGTKKTQKTIDCVQQELDIITAKNKTRYYLADFDQVYTACMANRGCSDREFEIKLLKLHSYRALQIYTVNVRRQHNFY